MQNTDMYVSVSLNCDFLANDRDYVKLVVGLKPIFYSKITVF